MYRILLVDDEPLILAGIASMMEWGDYDCVVADKATNGSQALEKIEEIQPDIVITDIKMPAMNGLEFMEECRNRGYQGEFILLTNLEEFSLAQRALRLGALDYLVKIEITPEILGESLQKPLRYVGKSRKQRAVRLFRKYCKKTQRRLQKNSSGKFWKIRGKIVENCGKNGRKK